MSGAAVGGWFPPWHSYGELGGWGSGSSVSGVIGTPGAYGGKDFVEGGHLFSLLHESSWFFYLFLWYWG